MPHAVVGSNVRPWRKGGDRFFATLLAGLLLAAPVAADEAGVRAFLVDYLSEGGQFEVGPAKATIAFVDLNADGVDEALVYLVGSYWCGSGGCNAYVLEAEGETYAIRMETSVTQPPLGVLESQTNGWRDVFVAVGGGGIAGGRVALRFDGESYPRNPTSAGKAIGEAQGEVLITGDEAGMALE